MHNSCQADPKPAVRRSAHFRSQLALMLAKLTCLTSPLESWDRAITSWDIQSRGLLTSGTSPLKSTGKVLQQDALYSRSVGNLERLHKKLQHPRSNLWCVLDSSRGTLPTSPNGNLVHLGNSKEGVVNQASRLRHTCAAKV
jgi:hypothetical protein